MFYTKEDGSLTKYKSDYKHWQKWLLFIAFFKESIEEHFETTMLEDSYHNLFPACKSKKQYKPGEMPYLDTHVSYLLTTWRWQVRAALDVFSTTFHRTQRVKKCTCFRYWFVYASCFWSEYKFTYLQCVLYKSLSPGWFLTSCLVYHGTSLNQNKLSMICFSQKVLIIFTLCTKKVMDTYNIDS